MAIYAISDLHLCLGVNKPMDIFGEGWKDYIERLENSWKNTVSKDDFVIIAGDISWATYLEQSYKDFEFINNLPGEKIILKGNHDYWWTTLKKLQAFNKKNNFTTIRFLHNNCYKVEDKILCGTRGWKSRDTYDFSREDEKIYIREINRLHLSLKCAYSTGKNKTEKNRIETVEKMNRPEDKILTGRILKNEALENKTSKDKAPRDKIFKDKIPKDEILGRDIIVAIHYMPFNSVGEPTEFVELMEEYGVKTCIYGHLHGEGTKCAIEGTVGGIEYHLTSADYLNFRPIRIT